MPGANIVFKALVGFTIIVSSQSTGAVDPRLEAVENYAWLEHHCALDHGYVCKPGDEADDFLSEQSDQQMIPANYLLAW